VGGFKNKAHTMAFANLIMACSASPRLYSQFLAVHFMMCFGGTAMPMFNTPATVLIQHKVEGNYLGRVFGIASMLQSFLMPMGMIMFGPLADTVDVKWLIAGGSGVIMLLSLMIYFSKTLTEAGKPLPQPNSTAEENKEAIRQEAHSQENADIL
jgi:DHA3 family macrolide efflux protein-like MFS transporter